MRARVLYGWARIGGFALSHLPPDVSHIPPLIFDSIEAAEEYVIKLNESRRRRVEVIWSGSALAEVQRLEMLRAQEQAQWLPSR
jgi:hypothetical protein